MYQWFIDNYVEAIAALTGIIAIFFQIKVNSWYWPISILNVLLYIFVFFRARLYAEISLQFYYLIMSIYGWFFWTKKKNNIKIAVSKTFKIEWLILSVLFLPVWLSMAILLKNYSNTDVPFIDSFLTTLSFVATYLLARKKLENWLIWIFVDFSSIGLYYYKHLYATIVLFAILTILAFVGYFEWRKQLNASV
ncbi:MAG TPA: nicotinamide riboside transporter PnuC [Bacteroidales bacterium]|jgi:nicotinamide mononucleotide transporter|nr:nicotinamide riboside transporter PnuC [Bacteroidales bacterium]